MSSRAEASYRSKSAKAPSLGKRIFGGIALFTLCIAGLVGGSIYRYSRENRFMGKVIGHLFNPKPPQETFGRQSLTILVLGCDEDVTYHSEKITKLQARSDMMMLARCDFAKNKLSALSIPRDTYCKLPGDKNAHKVNAFHAYGGNDLSKRAVETLLGVSIDRVVALDFEAFQQLVNVVGGVDVTVDKQLDYDDNAGKLHIHLKPGPQHMNGYQAMGFVRFRHADSDLARQLRQHQFLMALKDRIVHQPQALEEVAEMGQRVLGNEFTDDETISLALFGQKIPKQNVKLAQAAVIEKKHSNFLYLNKKQTGKLLAEMGFLPAGEMTASATEEPRHSHKPARNEPE